MTKIMNIDGVSVTVADDDPRLPPPYVPPVVVPTVTGDAIVGVLSDAQASSVKLRDLVRISANDAVPVTNPKLVRMASTIGMTADGLFAAAQQA